MSTDVRDEPGDVLRQFRALNDPEQRREIERHEGIFVVEGFHALEALVESAYPIRAVLCAENRAARALELVGRRAPVYVVSQDEIARIAGFNFHRGVLATGRRIGTPKVDDLVSYAERVAILEGINDHENLGALFRNARAFGIEAVLLDPTTADPLYRRSVRVSMGHVLHTWWTRCDNWPGVLTEMRERHGLTVVALTPASDAESIDDLAADPPEQVAFLLGAEGPGLSDAALRAADRRVRIPVADGVDSVNVATAAAVAFHRLALPGLLHPDR